MALPADARTKEQLEWVAEQVEEAGGVSSLWQAELTSRRDEQRLVRELIAARSAEYDAIIDRVAAATGPDAARVLRAARAELRAVERRDHFPTEHREQARTAVRVLGERVHSGEAVPS